MTATPNAVSATGSTPACKRCGKYPVHTAQSYYRAGGLCLLALFHYDCRKF